MKVKLKEIDDKEQEEIKSKKETNKTIFLKENGMMLDIKKQKQKVYIINIVIKSDNYKKDVQNLNINNQILTRDVNSIAKILSEGTNSSIQDKNKIFSNMLSLMRKASHVIKVMQATFKSANSKIV